MSVLVIYKIKEWEMPYTRKNKGDLYWHAALVTGELFSAALGRGAEGGFILWMQ